MTILRKKVTRKLLTFTEIGYIIKLSKRQENIFRKGKCLYMSLEMGLRTLKSKRVLVGLTQVEIAKKLGVTEKTYNMKENGKLDFSLRQVIQVSEILGLTLEEINESFLHLNIKS